MYFAIWLSTHLSYNVIDNHIIIRTQLLFWQYIMSFFDIKSMSILSRSDISFYQCKLIFDMLLHLLLCCTNVFLLMLSALWIYMLYVNEF